MRHKKLKTGKEPIKYRRLRNGVWEEVFKEKKVISVADLDKATQELLDSIRENRR